MNCRDDGVQPLTDPFFLCVQINGVHLRPGQSALVCDAIGQQQLVVKDQYTKLCYEGLEGYWC